jgi:glucose/mannose-6-phosphate isomerase
VRARATIAPMALEETLKRFREQFEWHPVVENPQKLGAYGSYIVAGMGGSHLGAWLIQKFDPHLELKIHRDYGLPALSDAQIRGSLFIASSYSGTTEETLDAASSAYDKRMHLAAISLGGPLIEFARNHELPFIQIPDTGLEPRMAIGYSMIGIARIMGNEFLERTIREGGQKVNPTEDQIAGMRLAEKLLGKVPLIYASNANLPLAYIWKVKFNETSKIPAFCNTFPELNHNEFTGFDIVDTTREISSKFHIIMLADPKDHPRVQKRMSLTQKMLLEKGIGAEMVTLHGEYFEKLFYAALMADWVSLGLANQYGVPNPETPLIAEFKKRMVE